jgi:predicted carbohydrate-binding protein with CBM5 and CBM33 domain
LKNRSTGCLRIDRHATWTAKKTGDETKELKLKAKSRARTTGLSTEYRRQSHREERKNQIAQYPGQTARQRINKNQIWTMGLGTKINQTEISAVCFMNTFSDAETTHYKMQSLSLTLK